MSAQRRYRSVRAVTEGTEADWQKRITDYAELRGWFWAHIPNSRYGAGDPGFPDLVLTRRGVLLFAELKMPGGRLTYQQVRWHQMLQHATGQLVHIWRPRDWPAIQEVLA